MAERPSCSQLIHNPPFTLAFALAHNSIVGGFAYCKKKMMFGEKIFCNA